MLRILGEAENVVRFQKWCGLCWDELVCSNENCPNSSSSYRSSDESDGDYTNARRRNTNRKENEEKTAYTNDDDSGTAKSRLSPENNSCSCETDINANRGKYGNLVITSYNPILHRIFEFGSELGNELFYITFLPFMYWNVDDFVARRLIILWVFNMYAGQGLKDVLQWPRPASPPVFRFVESQYNNEYGMPSTHAIAGSIIPFGLVYFSVGRFEYNSWLGLVFFFAWTSLVCFSRVYRGMHTFQDILAGLSVAAFVTALWLPYLDLSLEMFLSSPNAWIFILLIPLLMVYAFPTISMETRNDTTRITAVGVGCMMAAWSDYYLEGIPIADPFAGAPKIMFSSGVIPWLLFSASRFLIGMAILVTVKIVLKFLIFNIAEWIIFEHNAESKLNKSEKGPASVAIPYIFITYSAIGFFAVYVAPRAFEAVGLIL